jgi:alkaline phosphatase D
MIEIPVLNRRIFLGAASSALILAPSILRAQMLFAAYPFRLGVASGDPTSDGFVIWTRLAPDPLAGHGGMPMQPLSVQWEIGSDAGFKVIIRSGEAIARPELAHSVHVEVNGLGPDRPYWYRFTIGRERSFVGRARTAPLADEKPSQLRIGVVGCQNYENGLYTAYRHLSGQTVDFVYHYGDYIYECRSNPTPTTHGLPIAPVRTHIGYEPFSLDDYRRRYAQYKLDADLQAAHASAPFVAVFDDHEVDNNWAGDHDEEGAPPDIFRLRRAAALQAWYEHTPVRTSSLPSGASIRINRALKWGDLAHLNFLDTRQFRTPQPCDDGFKPACRGVNSADASMMGPEQEGWL